MFLHATAGVMIQFLHFLKVLCLSFARLRPGYALDPSYISDHLFCMVVASITLLNRRIKYNQPLLFEYCENSPQGLQNHSSVNSNSDPVSTHRISILLYSLHSFNSTRSGN